MPYESHPNLLTPTEDTVIWRYMDFARFMALLELRSLWFARADQFGDPLESMLTDAEAEQLAKDEAGMRAQNARPSWLRSSELMRATAYFSCWRAKPGESLAMWDLYGKGSGIIAIKSNVGELKRAVKDYLGGVYISLVEYIDWSQRGKYHNALVRSSRKELSYEHEAELRAILWPTAYAQEYQEKANKDLPIPEYPIGISIPVDPVKLIREVVVGPREHRWVYELVEHVLGRYGIQVPLSKSNRLTARARTPTS